jgi:hypothetical protein
VCLFRDATGRGNEANTFLASCTAHSLTQNRHVNMHTGTFPASARNDCPLTRFLLLRRMTGSPMSSLGVSFSDSVFPTPLRYGPSFPEHLRRVDVSFIKSTMPFHVCVFDTKALPHHLQGFVGRIQSMVSPSRKHLIRIGHAQHVCLRSPPSLPP